MYIMYTEDVSKGKIDKQKDITHIKSKMQNDSCKFNLINITRYVMD